MKLNISNVIQCNLTIYIAPLSIPIPPNKRLATIREKHDCQWTLTSKEHKTELISWIQNKKSSEHLVTLSIKNLIIQDSPKQIDQKAINSFNHHQRHWKKLFTKSWWGENVHKNCMCTFTNYKRLLTNNLIILHLKRFLD